MKHLTYILLLLTLQLTASHNAGASTTVQSQDIIIIDKVEHKLNEPLLFQLDSATYSSLEERLDFRSAIFSWNFRGHVATFEVQDSKLFLNSIETSTIHTDFNGLLDKYVDKNCRVFASWVSGTFICGTGKCLYVAANGFDSVYEKETELVVESGVVISSRTYTNKTYGTVCLEDVTFKITPEFDLTGIPAPKGRVTVRIDASEFNTDGKVIEWSVEFLRGHDDLTDQIKEMIVKEVNRVFRLFDWKTYSRDREWQWLPTEGVTYPLIFNK